MCGTGFASPMWLWPLGMSARRRPAPATMPGASNRGSRGRGGYRCFASVTTPVEAGKGATWR